MSLTSCDLFISSKNGAQFQIVDLELCVLIKIFQFIIISDDFQWNVKKNVFVKRDKKLIPWNPEDVLSMVLKIFTFLHLLQKDIFVHSSNEAKLGGQKTDPQSFVWLSRQGSHDSSVRLFFEGAFTFGQVLWNQHAIVILLAMTGTKGRLTDSHTDCKLIWLGIPLSFLY